MYGWPHQLLPDFKELAKSSNSIRPMPTALAVIATSTSDVGVVEKDPEVEEIFIPVAKSLDELSDRNKKGWEHLVMALLAFWKGEIPIKHGLDPYENLGDLQQVISQHYSGVLNSLGQTTIDTKFGLANAHREKVGLRPIKHLVSPPVLKNAHKAKINS